jgi:cation diffusion facilitator CzcD-associated flavoprotein CzcO
MFTLGYVFRPWTEAKAIADGPSILAYVRETAREGGIEPHIRFRHKVVRADFDSARGTWTVVAETPEGERRFSAPMLLSAAGYYSYDHPHDPKLEGEGAFGGRIFHAQHWPRDLDWAGKRVVVIGSGATAVTIVPVLAETAAKVTMLQRSPTWMVSRPSVDRLANLVRAVLPAQLGYDLVRWRNTMLQTWVFKRVRAHPEKAGERLLKMLKRDLPEEVIAKHFTPSYRVWDQRLCLVPDSDFFKAMRAGRAEVVTDRVRKLDKGGIELESGGRIDADIIVKATGLSLQMLGGAQVAVDGEPVDLPQRFTWRGMMLEGVPNLLYVFGYFNASWTLRADLTSAWFCRLIAEMDRRGAAIAVPERDGPPPEVAPPFMSSGYVQRALPYLPKQASEGVWRDLQDYRADREMLLEGPLADASLKFRQVTARVAPEPVPEPAE